MIGLVRTQGVALEFALKQLTLLPNRKQSIIRAFRHALESGPFNREPNLTSKSRKSRVFVGSSAESLPHAYAVQENLDPHDADVKVWPQGVFDIGSYGLESLLEAVKSHDFGVFVFAPDDVTIIRKVAHKVVRDNVIFELGLFMGGLGRERTFVIAPTGIDLHLPTDLLGWNVAHYDPNRADTVAAMGIACNQIRLAIRRLGNFKPGAPTTFVASAARLISGAAPFKSLTTAKTHLKSPIGTGKQSAKSAQPGSAPPKPGTPMSSRRVNPRRA
jgi:predicted nucleotide-binding protein